MFSYWEKTTFFANADFLIIGSGFTGLWTGLELRKKFPTKKIKVLERGILPTGASTKNAGFSCFGSPSELIADAKLKGKEKLWNLTFKRYEGLRKIHNTFSYNTIDYVNTGGYECLTTEDLALVEANLDWLNADFNNLTGNKDVFSYDAIEHHGLNNFAGIVKNKLEGALHPAKLVQQLYQKCIETDIEILFNINVQNLITINSGLELNTSLGKLCANKVIVCTNGFMQQMYPNTDIIAQRGQLLLTKEIANLKINGCYHSNEGFFYFRNIGKKLLIGGARNLDLKNEQTSTIETTKTIQDALISFTKKHIMESFEIEEQWAGIMGFGPNKEPLVQEIEPNVYCAVGLSGMGVALAPILAEEVVSLIP